MAIKQLISLAITVLSCTATAAPLDLLNDPKFKAGGWQTKFSKSEDGSYTVTGPAGKPWPGFSMHAKPAFDAYPFATLAATVTNLGDTNLEIFISAADKANNVVTSMDIAPQQTTTLVLPLARKDEAWNAIDLKGMRTTPWMERLEPPPNLRQTVRFGIAVNNTPAPFNYRVSTFELRGTYKPTALPDPWFPCIDAFGQYQHKNWPGKITSVDDLHQAAKDEALTPPPSSDRFGGYVAGTSWPATNTFATKRLNDSWTLVNPDGKPFFSFGMNAVNLSRQTPVEEREHWFQDLPIEGTPGARFFGRAAQATNHGYFKGRRTWCFDHLQSNLFRKHGPEWKEKTIAHTFKRLKSWGVNTIGAWGAPEFIQDGHPYTLIVHPWAQPIDASDSYWGKFPDVYAPSFADGIAGSLKALSATSRKSPWCLGIFIDNELPWSDDDLALALQTLRSPPTQPAKRVFIRQLQHDYHTIEALNAKWGTAHKSWEALLKTKQTPDRNRAKADLEMFAKNLAETYFKTCRNLVRRYAPGRLYLGCRFAQNNTVASAAAVKYCDVVSVNLYYPPEMLTDYTLPGQPAGAAPLLMGEFHYGARDRGVARGLRGGDSQADRVRMTTQFLDAIAAHPGFVGAHWFELYDQPVSGRPKDGENYHVGFIDITDSPYVELTDAVRNGLTALHQRRFSSSKKPPP